MHRGRIRPWQIGLEVRIDMETERQTRPARRPLAVMAIFFVLALAVGLLVRYPVWTADRPSTGQGETMNTTVESNIVTKEAIFAGGCFWCIESAFELMPGVVEAISGYTGGHVKNPSYAQVSAGTTGHFEAVLVKYDPAQVTYEQLLDQLWRHIDPTDAGGQFYDRGSQYLTAIFYLDEAQRESAEASKRMIDESGIFNAPIVTQILPAQAFYPAEDYHQDYYRTCAVQYNAYSRASGREAYLEQTWEGQKPSDSDSSEDD